MMAENLAPNFMTEEEKQQIMKLMCENQVDIGACIDLGDGGYGVPIRIIKEKEPEENGPVMVLEEAMKKHGLTSLKEVIDGAEAGNTALMEALGIAYLTGIEVKRSPKMTFYWYHRLAEAGLPWAMYTLALYYAKGFPVERDLHAAVSWMWKAACAGDEDALEQLPYFTEFRDLYDKAKKGDAEAQGKTAARLLDFAGKVSVVGPYVDLFSAYRIAQLSAKQGDAYGTYILGLCYEEGMGTSRNLRRAKKAYRRAIELGYEDAEWEYALLLQNDRNPRKRKESDRLFDRVLERKDPRVIPYMITRELEELRTRTTA